MSKTFRKSLKYEYHFQIGLFREFWRWKTVKNYLQFTGQLYNLTQRVFILGHPPWFTEPCNCTCRVWGKEINTLIRKFAEAGVLNFFLIYIRPLIKSSSFIYGEQFQSPTHVLFIFRGNIIFVISKMAPMSHRISLRLKICFKHTIKVGITSRFWRLFLLLYLPRDSFAGFMLTKE